MKTLHVMTQRPKALLDAIKTDIVKGEIETWTVDSDGDLIHGTKQEDGKISGQWAGQAWLRPKAEGESLVLRLIPQKDRALGPGVEGVYLGRFAEMLVNHFPNAFTSIVIQN